MTRGAVRGGRPHLAHAERAARGSAGAARAVRGVVSQPPPASPTPCSRPLRPSPLRPSFAPPTRHASRLRLSAAWRAWQCAHHRRAPGHVRPA
eukprot:scaffold129705_cov63-Phaeocystis_antarctica.AAC.2